MKQKKTVAIVLAALLVLPFCLAGAKAVNVEAANTSNMRYYYNQLPEEAKQLYDAMYQMYTQGVFKTGAQTYDLVANGHMTQEQLAAYGENYGSLLRAFGAARDAFYADYPDIFYVDFSSIAISVEGGGSGEFRAYIGPREGKDTYYVDGFGSLEQVEGAIGEHEARVNGIVQAAGGAQSVREQVIAAHNAIIENTAYVLEGGSHIRTSYGALVKGESLCEGYARAVKTVLDSMGISSVLVQGWYQDTDGSKNLHMWNYVQVDGKWYGVDATTDDGMSGSPGGSSAYLLVDGSVMGQHHIPDGVMSEAGFSFSYPELEGGGSQGGGTPDNGGAGSGDYQEIFSQGGLRVEYRDGTEYGEEMGLFKVSYNGMGYQQSVDKEGVYILARFYQYVPATGEDVAGDWGYMDPKPFALPEMDDCLLLPNGNSRLMEFAVTKVPPAGPLYGDNLTAEELQYNLRFHGTDSDFLAASGQLENPKGNYVTAPAVIKLTPSATGFLDVGRKYSITAVFSEQLEEYDGQTAGYELTVTDGWSAIEYSKIENFKWDGDRTITLDFTPSEMLADSSAIYHIQVTGLRGKGSLKVPGEFSYDVKKKMAICAYRPQGYFWNVFGKPELLEPGDLSCNNWELASGERLGDVVSNIALVASKPELEVTVPDAQQSQQMKNKITEKLGDKVVKSATYNIGLRMCNTSVVRTGSSVRMSIGFPEGYGPESEGVVFKAYHFIKGPDGSIVDVEEIGCTVTNVGLVICCKSFSPFAVAAVEADKESALLKHVLFLNSEGGEVEGEKIRTLKKTESQVVNVTAKEGYCISSIILSGEEVPVTDLKSMGIEIAYDKLVYDESIVDVKFSVEQPKEETPEEPDHTEESGSGEESEDIEQSEDSSEPDNSQGQDTANGGNASVPPAGSNGQELAAPSTAATQDKAAGAEAAAAKPVKGTAAGTGAAVKSKPAAEADSKPDVTIQTEKEKEQESGVTQDLGQKQEVLPQEPELEQASEEAEKPESAQEAEEVEVRGTIEEPAEDAEPGGDFSFWLILAAILCAGIAGVAIVVLVKTRQ